MLQTRIRVTLRCFMVCCYLNLLGLFAFAQAPYFINYQLSDGLPSNFTYAVFQDSLGYIWVGTDLGVSRFDGTTFENFSTKDGLADNEVFNFFEDSRGRIWFHTFNGEVSFYEAGRFYNPDNHPNLWKAKTGNYISHITEDREQNIFISFYTDYGFLKLNGLDAPVWTFKDNQRLSSSYMFFGKDGQLYLCAELGICTFDREMKIDFAALGLPTKSGTARGFETEHFVFIGKGKEILVIDKKTVEILHILKIKEIDSEIIHIRYFNEKLYAGTRNGVFEITPESDHFATFSYRKMLDGYSVSATLLDREQNLWFSTLEAGLFFSPANQSQHWTSADGLGNNQVLTIDTDQKGRLWIGYPEYQFSIWDENNLQHNQLYDPNPLNIQGTVHFAPNEHWVLGQRQILLYDSIRPRYFFTSVDDLLKDQYNQYWIGHSKLFRLEQEELFANLEDQHDPDFKQKVTRRLNYFADVEPIDRRRFTCLESDFRNRIWAGSTNGLKCFIYDSTSVTDQYEILDIKGKISALVYDPEQDYLWVGNSTDGISLLHGDSVIYTLDEVGGLSSNFITALHLDDQQNLWAGTTKGVDRISTKGGSPELERFSREHGLFDLKVNDITDKNKTLYVASDEGIITLPFQLPQLDKHPTIQISQFQVNEETINPLSLQSLSYDENDLQFRFSSPTFRDQGNLHFEYRLLGDQTAWLQAQSDQVRYSSLSPGEYTFEVRAVNDLGLKSPASAKISFRIKAPFWQKAWFLILTGALILGLSAFLIQRQIRRIRKKHEIQQQLSAMRNDRLELEKQFLDLEMRALRIQMNPHFMFNALNTIKGYYSQNKVREASAYISKFGKLLRMILTNNDSYIALEDEIHILEFYIDLIKIRYDDKFDYSINVNPGLNTTELVLPSMLLQPMVENAIIHGLAPLKTRGHIEIIFETDGQYLISRVRDNGIGRAASARLNKHKMHESKAIAINQERLEIINGKQKNQDYFRIHDLTYADGSPAGTEVVIKTPLKKRW